MNLKAVWVILSIAALGACSHDYTDCTGGNYRGACMSGTPEPPAVSPVARDPAIAPSATGPYAAPVDTGPAAVRRGDPREFADVDDRQCRSYGLVFGSHDYADCRIRLSAQHRGLDPSIGTTTPGPTSR